MPGLALGPPEMEDSRLENDASFLLNALFALCSILYVRKNVKS